MARARRQQSNRLESRLDVACTGEPMAALSRDARDLPRIDQHWLGGWRVFGAPEGGPRRAALVWMEHPTLLVRSCTVVDEEDASEALVFALFAAMAEPLPGCARGVPRRLSIAEPTLVAPLARLLAPLEVRVEPTLSRDAKDALHLAADTLAYGDQAYLYGPGADHGLLRRFFSRCADLWKRRLCERGHAEELFRIDGLRLFPVMASLSRDDGESHVRVFMAHLDCVLGDILQASSPRGLRVLNLSFVRAGEVAPAFFEEARRRRWHLPRPDVAPVLSVVHADEGPCLPGADDLEVMVDVLEALLLWDGKRTLNDRTLHRLRSGRRVRLAGPSPLSGEASFPSVPR